MWELPEIDGDPINLLTFKSSFLKSYSELNLYLNDKFKVNQNDETTFPQKNHL